MEDAYGRVTGPGGQLQNPAYLPALVAAGTAGPDLTSCSSRRPRRPGSALTPGRVVPGLERRQPAARRAGTAPAAGATRIAFTNRYGALLHGTVYRPKPGARDPYTGAVLRGPFPGVVITEGSVQGSEGMYRWLAQDLAERGYVVLTYDVQGQGGGETLPHERLPGGDSNALPFCNPFATPAGRRAVRLPRRPAQQLSNFVVGTEDALSFFTSTPVAPLRQPALRGRERERLQPLLAALRPLPRHAHGRPRAAPRGSRSSATRWAPPRSRRCRAPTSASRPSSPSTS